jgi:hypothetical protein
MRRSILIRPRDFCSPTFDRAFMFAGRRPALIVWCSLLLAACESQGGTDQADGLVFHSDWGTSTGTSDDALTDGGRWDDAAFATQQIDVVDAATYAPGAPTVNVYRVRNRAPVNGGTTYSWVEKAGLWVDPQIGESRYWRVYLYNATNDDQGDLSDGDASYHPLEYGSAGAGEFNLIFSTRNDGTFSFKFAPLMAEWPKSRWIPSSGMNAQAFPGKFRWYRIEWSLTKTATNTFTMHARMFSRAPDGTETAWQGDSTLRDAQLNLTMAAGGTGVGIDETVMQYLRLGTNSGGVWAALTADQYVYWAAVCVRSDTWCGPYNLGI